MYLDFFGLKREPFHISPDPYFFYFGPTHKEAFAALVYAIKNRKGFVAITGEVGLGKTTVVRAFLNHYRDENRLKIIVIFNTKVSFKNLLKLILLELGFKKEKILQIEQNAKDEESFEVEAVDLLYEYLIEKYKRGINVALILDEAQNLPVITLEKLRLISNLETDRNKLIQIFLIGQPELDKKLSLKSLRQLKQRIELRVKLRELTKKEVKKYIDYRLKKAGYVGEDIFTKSAIKKIYKYSKGIPRKINIICDNALITAFGKDKRKIGPKIIEEVCKELYFDEKRSTFNILSYVLIFSVIFIISFYFGTHLNDIQPNLFFTKDSNKNAYQSKSSIISKITLQPRNRQNVIRENAKLNSTITQTKSMEEVKINKTDNSTYNEKVLNKTMQNEDKNIIDNNTNVIQEHIELENIEKTNVTQKKMEAPNSSILKNTLLSKLDTSGKIIYLILYEKLAFFKKLSNVRQIVLVEMARQTSITGLFSFKKMLNALEQGDYTSAARHMLYSNWYKRVGDEALILSQIMETNNKDMLLKWLEQRSTYNIQKNLNIAPSKNQPHNQQDTAH